MNRRNETTMTMNTVDGEQEAANTESEAFGFTAAGHFGDDETKLSVMFEQR